MEVLKKGEVAVHISLNVINYRDKSLKNAYIGFDTVRHREDYVNHDCVVDL